MNNSTKQRYERYKQYSINIKRYYRVPSVQKSLSVVLSIFISAFFIVVAISPTLNAITKLKRTIVESKEVLIQLKAKTTALQEANVVWERIQPMQTQIEASVPSRGPDYQTITKTLEVVALENEIKLSNETLGEALIYSSIIDPYTGRKRTVIQMPYAVSVVGSYQQITNFLKQTLQLARVMSVESLSIGKNTGKDRGDSLTLSLNLNGQIYYLADEEQLASILGAK